MILISIHTISGYRPIRLARDYEDAEKAIAEITSLQVKDVIIDWRPLEEELGLNARAGDDFFTLTWLEAPSD